MMLNRAYCTYFDHNYLPRGLALYRSLQRHAPGARLWVLCLSDACHQALMALALPNLVPVRLGDFEAAEPEVAATRPTRSMIEYYFTLTPAWILFVLNREPGLEWVTYLDSDLFFYASPEPIYEEMKGAAFGIIPHRFSRRQEEQRKYGLYNVGWVSARNCDDGISALGWWRARCIEWCYDHVDGDRFADQRYLDRLPELFTGVHVIEHLGANLAPWNFAGVRLERRNGSVEIDGQYQLLFFHFYGVKRSGDYYFNSHRLYRAPFSRLAKHEIYQPYVSALADAERTVAPWLGAQQVNSIRKPVAVNLGDRLSNALRKARVTLNRGLDIVTGRANVVRNAPVR
jgi:hypothetical protein